MNASLLTRLFQQSVGLPLEVGALALLRADVEKPHPGLGPPQDMLSVVGAHKGKLQQIFRGALGGGAAVDEDRAPVGTGNDGRHSRPANPTDALGDQGSPGEQSPRGPGGDKGVPLPIFHQIKPHSEGGILLLLKGGSGIVLHVHHLRGVDDLQPRRGLVHAHIPEDGKDLIPPAHQDYLQPQLPDSLHGPLHIGAGSVVAAHGVYDDFHADSSLME